MALGRTLTKKLQKLNKSVRKLDSGDDDISPKYSGSSDEFVSISFEDTCENRLPATDSDASSITSVNNSTIPYNRTPSSSTTSNSILTLSDDTPLTSGLNTPAATTPGLTSSPQSSFLSSTKALINTGSFSRDLLPLLNSSGTGGPTTTSHQSNPSNASSRYSPILPQTQVMNLSEPFFVSDPTLSSKGIRSALDSDKTRIINEEEQDAKADEMAMYILEKVNADEYIEEIKTGSWSI